MWEFIINVNNVTVLFLGFNEEAKEVLIEDPLTGQVLEEFEQLGHNHLHELYHDTDFCKEDTGLLRVHFHNPLDPLGRRDRRGQLCHVQEDDQ